MELIELYTKILESTGWEVNSNGVVTGFKGPIEVAGKTLILPTNTVLRNPDWDNTIAFHPMSENVMRGESAIQFELRQQMQFHLNFTAATILQVLGEVAADEAAMKRLTTNQKEYLKLVPDFDQKTIKALDSLLDKCNPNEPEKIISLFVKRGGELEGKNFKRLAVLRSPLRDEIDNKDRTIFGVKFRKADFKPFFKMFDFFFPDINEGNYCFGSNSMVAPSFHALLGGYLKMAKRMNVVVRKFQKVWGEDFEDLLIDTSWEDHVKDLDAYKGIIPNLRGNEGSVNPDEVESVEAEKPEQTGAPKSTKKLNWADKAEQQQEESRKMTLSEKIAQAAAPAAPANTFAKPAPAETSAPASGKMSFAEKFGGGAKTNAPTQRQSTPYGQSQFNGFQQQQQQSQQNNFGASWASPQGTQSNFGQPQGRQATPYFNSNQNQGGFNRSGW